MNRSAYSLLIIGLMAISSSSWAARNELVRSDLTSRATPAAQPIATEAIYKLSRDSEVQPLAETIRGQNDESGGFEVLGLNQNEPVAVQFNQDDTVSLSLLLVPEEQGVIPEKIVISKADFEKLSPEFVSYGGLDEFYSEYSPYEESKSAARGAGRRGRLHSRGAKGCVAYVKDYLRWNGPLGNGKEVTTTLKKTGKWKKISCSNPPIGAIASWTGGSHGAGHTAVWKGKGWCYDLNCNDPGRKYKMRECVARK